MEEESREEEEGREGRIGDHTDSMLASVCKGFMLFLDSDAL